MSHPSTPSNNGNSQRPRNRGAIRTHLGRKRVGPRSRPLRDSPFGEARAGGTLARGTPEMLFDRLLDTFQGLFAKAGETTASAFESALDTACTTLITAGEFTAENAQRLREYLRRDLLQRDHPQMTFRTGDITSAGTLTCSGCGWTILTTRTTVLPPCPQCTETSFRKTA